MILRLCTYLATFCTTNFAALADAATELSRQDKIGVWLCLCFSSHRNYLPVKVLHQMNTDDYCRILHHCEQLYLPDSAHQQCMPRARFSHCLKSDRSGPASFSRSGEFTARTVRNLTSNLRHPLLDCDHEKHQIRTPCPLHVLSCNDPH